MDRGGKSQERALSTAGIDLNFRFARHPRGAHPSGRKCPSFVGANGFRVNYRPPFALALADVCRGRRERGFFGYAFLKTRSSFSTTTPIPSSARAAKRSANVGEYCNSIF